jgi:glutathione synthase/RimK-type ligase-like ATP-grasp enzyme
LSAARAAGTALVGVDLVPDADGNWTVIELNGAVEFTHEYQPGGNIFAEVASVLARRAVDVLAALESARATV